MWCAEVNKKNNNIRIINHQNMILQKYDLKVFPLQHQIQGLDGKTFMARTSVYTAAALCCSHTAVLLRTLWHLV